ncbi:FecCD family ABC transporter permease [Vibrio cholerae]|uniref:FecCD family ABC transporter permease n=1 Tax=Vibrio cholerae TaxID=666 RepID=UPI001159DF00|nr:iron chelate uptake ABC transporter family permease subunit [Vibrio cholerae]TQQ27804.1 iron chelate uptake ABC transporter family permease subunit [Vibrio cholerae]
METITSVAPEGRSNQTRFWLWRKGAYTLRVERRNIAVASVLSLIVLALMILATCVGKLPISISDVTAILLGEVTSGFKRQVLLDIRLPRIFTALFAGAALGLSGAIFQSISRNPLGSPDIIGFTSGAATGALLQIILFAGSGLAVAFSAIAGGVMTAIAVYLLSVKSGTVGRYRLVLTGIGVGSVLTALNGLLLVKGSLDSAITANLWLSGSLHAREWSHVLPVMCGVLVLLIKGLARSLQMLEMGDEIARQLGVAVEPIRLFMILAAVTLAALATGAAGPIAFIALAAPQLAARLRQTANTPLVSAGLMGACLLLGADLLTQWMPLALTLPIGRITGLVGGMYLLILLMRSKNTV